jgi:hypothetical protein
MKYYVVFSMLLFTAAASAQNVGIGMSTPINGRLVVRGTVGAVSALFGDNTTGIAIENSYPGIGLNTYYNGTRKYIAPGFGGLIGLNPTNGDMYFMNTAITGVADANASILTRLFISGANGNIGINTVNPSNGKLTLDVTGTGTGIYVSSTSGTTSAMRAENFSAGAGYALNAYSQNGTAILASTLGTGAALNASGGVNGLAITTSGKSQLDGPVGLNSSPDGSNVLSIDVNGFDDGINVFSNSGASVAARLENFGSSGSAIALIAYSQNGTAINASSFGSDASDYAVNATGKTRFSGDMSVIGTLSKSAGTFKIDHPQDPANKFLIHSFVESPDMMNVYNGNITTDATGMAVVQLPAYFEAENIDYKYQLTTMGKDFARVLVYEEIHNSRFVIKTDKPSIKVSWQVTGVRNDAYAKKFRVVPELNKTAEEKGKYLTPELFGQPKERAIGHVQEQR